MLRDDLLTTSTFVFAASIPAVSCLLQMADSDDKLGNEEKGPRKKREKENQTMD